MSSAGNSKYSLDSTNVYNIVSLNPALRKRDLSSQVDLESLFPANPTCVLAPELTIGPYCMFSLSRSWRFVLLCMLY